MEPDFDGLLEAECAKLEALSAPIYPIKILVNIYELDYRHRWLKGLGVGLFHTGVEITGREIGYGGHPHKGTGIFVTHPLQMDAPAVFAGQIYAGVTKFSYQQIADILRDLATTWLGSNYHLLRHNCNHFTEELIAKLCGTAGLPAYINRAACVAEKLGCAACLRGPSKGRTTQLDLQMGPKINR